MKAYGANGKMDFKGDFATTKIIAKRGIRNFRKAARRVAKIAAAKASQE